MENHKENSEISSNQTDTFTITGNWDRLSRQLKKKYCHLTPADMKFEKGQEEKLFERMMARLNKTRSEVIWIIKAG